MIGSIEALNIFLILFPGFLVEILLEAIEPHEQRDTLQRLTRGFFFSLLVYGLYSVLVELSHLTLHVHLSSLPFEATGGHPYLKVHLIESLLVLSIVAIIALFYRRIFKTFMKILFNFKLTNQTGSVDAWTDAHDTLALAGDQPIAQVKLKDGTIIRGLIRNYSTPPSPMQVFITAEEGDPLEITNESHGELLKLDSDGILICNFDDVSWIRFEQIENSDYPEPWLDKKINRFSRRTRKAKIKMLRFIRKKKTKEAVPLKFDNTDSNDHDELTEGSAKARGRKKSSKAEKDETKNE